MSERAFRAVLVAVVVIWVIFVLVPSVLDNAPRVWSTLQYVLPGSNPMVQVTVRDAGPESAVEDARVQIIMDGVTLTAFTDKQGKAIFAGVPAGQTKQIRVQKTNYEIGLINDVVIPHRQRTRYQVNLLYSGERRLFVGHEAGSGIVSITLIDAASRLALTAPGQQLVWENVLAFDVRASQANQRVYALSPGRLTVISMGDRGVIRQLPLEAPATGMALSSNGDTAFIVVNTSGRLRMLLAVDTSTWVTRFRTQIDPGTGRAVLLVAPDGSRIFVASAGDSAIGAYSTRGAGRVGTYRSGEPIKDMALADDGRSLYALTEHRLQEIRVDQALASGTDVLDTAEAEAVAGATRMIYAEYQYTKWLCLLQPEIDQVTLISLTDKKVYTTAVGQEPAALAHAYASSDVYVANRSDDSLSVVSLPVHKLVDTIDVRSRPVLLTTQ